MTGAWEKFKSARQEHPFVRPGDRVLLAVSGGPDSVALMHLFWRLRKTVPIGLCAASLDHGLRSGSARDAKFVEKLGRSLDIPVVVRAIPVRRHAASKKLSLETAGRELRYRELVAAARELDCGIIATGHTANDNAETVLMWLARGTGAEGLAGIPAEREESGIRVIRPLLAVTRKEIIGYLKEQRLAFRVDRSNSSSAYTRNRFRAKIIPLLEANNPRFVEHVYGLSRIIGSENAYLRSMSVRAARLCVRRNSKSIILDLSRLFRYNEVIRSRVLKEVLPEKRSMKNIERLLAWARSSSRSGLVLSRSWRVEKKAASMVFRRGGKTP